MASNNFAAIHDFLDEWRPTGLIIRTPAGHVEFAANVIYETSNLKIVQKSYVTILRNGIEEGRVDIDEAGALNITDFHLRFEVRFQTYEFEVKSKALVISGSSPKMSGKYSVTIFPT